MPILALDLAGMGRVVSRQCETLGTLKASQAVFERDFSLPCYKRVLAAGEPVRIAA